MVPVAISRPSGLMATLVRNRFPAAKVFEDPSAMSQTFTVPSFEAEMIDLPSGENTIEEIFSV